MFEFIQTYVLFSELVYRYNYILLNNTISIYLTDTLYLSDCQSLAALLPYGIVVERLPYLTT